MKGFWSLWGEGGDDPAGVLGEPEVSARLRPGEGKEGLFIPDPKPHLEVHG